MDILGVLPFVGATVRRNESLRDFACACLTWAYSAEREISVFREQKWTERPTPPIAPPQRPGPFGSGNEWFRWIEDASAQLYRTWQRWDGALMQVTPDQRAERLDAAIREVSAAVAAVRESAFKVGRACFIKCGPSFQHMVDADAAARRAAGRFPRPPLDIGKIRADGGFV